MGRKTSAVLLLVLLSAASALGQAPPSAAHSQDETLALAYMRTVIYAQKDYKKKHGQYATSLAALVHFGSFTKRMANTDRGAYTVQFRGKPDTYSLALTPRQFDADHRAFYANETGKIHVEEGKSATAESPPLK